MVKLYSATFTLFFYLTFVFAAGNELITNAQFSSDSYLLSLSYADPNSLNSIADCLQGHKEFSQFLGHLKRKYRLKAKAVFDSVLLTSIDRETNNSILLELGHCEGTDIEYQTCLNLKFGENSSLLIGIDVKGRLVLFDAATHETVVFDHRVRLHHRLSELKSNSSWFELLSFLRTYEQDGNQIASALEQECSAELLDDSILKVNDCKNPAEGFCIVAVTNKSHISIHIKPDGRILVKDPGRKVNGTIFTSFPDGRTCPISEFPPSNRRFRSPPSNRRFRSFEKKL